MATCYVPAVAERRRARGSPMSSKAKTPKLKPPKTPVDTVEAAMNECLAVLKKHNVAGSIVVSELDKGRAGMMFPKWSRVQYVDGVLSFEPSMAPNAATIERDSVEVLGKLGIVGGMVVDLIKDHFQRLQSKHSLVRPVAPTQIMVPRDLARGLRG